MQPILFLPAFTKYSAYTEYYAVYKYIVFCKIIEAKLFHCFCRFA